MAAYVIVSSVTEAGWLAPEVIVTAVAVTVAVVSWLLRSKERFRAD